MLQTTRELWLAFIAILTITALYLFVALSLGSIPAARGFFGHSLGILGFTLMLMTETLYSRRKRSRRAGWGKMASWLQFHIFTGLVGPYLVLLHTSFKFNGLAGVVMLLTVVVVASGFVGRYIYTAIPRTAEGAEVEAGDLQRAIGESETALQNWLAANAGAKESELLAAATAATAFPGGLSLVFGRGLRDLRQRLAWRRLRRRMGGVRSAQINVLESLIRRRQTYQRQVASLTAARRMLAVWHSVHVPIGMTLFFAAVVHILGAIYYASLLR